MLADRAAASATTVPMGASLLIVAALFVAAAAALMVNTTTMAVALIAWACLLAIYARIAQAAAHHREIMTALKSNVD
ncbi:MAG: hypothetical protein DMF84_11615 [Acidobacteria bacterium]|nr:MAG: hypothetical protein DMF84_11615 [Acidobacteriota bacterium]